MNVCDVPLCPNLSVGSTQPLLGAPKGVPRINKTFNETRDRLRTRLNQRKAKHPLDPNVSYSVQVGSLNKNASQETIVNDKCKLDLPKVGSPVNDSGNMTKKSNGDMCGSRQLTDSPSIKRGNTRRCDIGLCQNLAEYRASIPKEFEKLCQLDDCDDKLSFTRCDSKFEDIDKIMKFIEGKDHEIAQKKAAKKARQKQRKQEERRKREEEEMARQKAEEERIKEERRLEEERLRALEAALKKARAKNKSQQATSHPSDKSSKKNKKNKVVVLAEPELLEETIPAMVTIKRIVENNNSPPTVTITLKGSTPDQDKLLYTLVNGHNNRSVTECPNKTSQCLKKEEGKGAKKKKKNSIDKTETSNELKVTLSVDKSFRKELENKNNIQSKIESNHTKSKKQTQQVQQQSTGVKEKVIKIKEKEKPKMKENIIDIPSLKLPPGITITKVNGPLTNRKVNNVQSSDYQSVPVNKSGVIVVDTEKLIQQSIGSKKNKKKKKKVQPETTQEEETPKAPPTEPSMVTLKNPIFEKMQSTFVSQPETTPHLMNINEQATISKGANGMVTIRRPRQMTMQNESPITEYLSPVMQSANPLSNPNVGTCYMESKSTLSEERKIIQPPSPRPTSSMLNARQLDSDRLSDRNGDIWQLPGIEIKKIPKDANQSYHGDNSTQKADVSIIRTSGFNLERDDWPYDVFIPKEIVEDDLDADELELEAFKRFCQQSVPPKHKEKVAHLNVKDIFLMKKNDINYS